MHSRGVGFWRGIFVWENTPFVWSRDMDSHFAGSRENEHEKSFFFSCLIRFAVFAVLCVCEVGAEVGLIG